MIMWNRLDPKAFLVEVLGVPKNEKTALTVRGALDDYTNAEGIEYPTQVKLWSKKVMEHIDGKKLINAIVVKDTNEMFKKVWDKENEATAYRVRATLINSINYGFTGRMPEAKPVPQEPIAPEMMSRLKFTAAKLEDIRALIPVFEKQGRFGPIKTEVYRLIHSLAAGEAGVITAPKKSMDKKEAKAIVANVQMMLTKNSKAWTIRWNEVESVFIVIRKIDLENIKSKLEKGA